MNSYRETSFNNTVTVNPKPNHKVLRVKARLEHVATTPDLPYAPWALDFSSFDNSRTLAEPTRVIQDNFTAVVGRNNFLIPCDYVCEGCHTLRRLVVTSPNRILCSGDTVGRGAAFYLDLIFCIPDDLDAVQLLVYGAPPVPVTVTR
jgi:hypothetical protein